MGQSQAKLHERAYADLARHRQTIYNQQLAAQRRCDTLKLQAQQQLQLGNKEGALALARQMQMTTNHAAQLGAVISNLDAQKAQLETKEMVNTSHQVLKTCVQTLGSRMITAQELDRTMDRHDNVSAELADVAEMLAMPMNSTSTDDDALLASLTNGISVLSSNTAGTPLAQVAALDPDTAFLDYVQYTLARVSPLPSVPEHVPLPPAPSHSLGSSKNMVM